MSPRLVVLAVLTAGWLTAARAEATADPERVSAFLEQQLKQRQIPGMQVAVVRGGQLVFSKGFGLANVQDGVPVTPQTVFPLNSITKAFTGVALMQLVEGGKLSLDAPVSRVLPGLPKAWQAVTLRQLATHTSGLPDVDVGAAPADRLPSSRPSLGSCGRPPASTAPPKTSRAG